MALGEMMKYEMPVQKKEDPVVEVEPTDIIPGGQADNKTIEDIAEEHSSDPEIAEEIATDHIAELGPDYYPELKKMEEKLIKQQPKKQIDMEFGTGTKIKNYSYDNEKDQDWFISNATTEGLTISHKRFGTRKQLDDVTMTWKEFKELVVEDVLQVDDFEGKNVKYLGLAIKDLIQNIELENKKREIQATEPLKKKLEKIEKIRKTRRESIKPDIKKKAEKRRKLQEEISNEEALAEFERIIELYTEMAEDEDNPDIKNEYLLQVEMAREEMQELKDKMK